MSDTNQENVLKEQGNAQTIIIQNGNVSGNALGIASFVFGLISIFILSPLFVPLGIILGTIALIKKQLLWGSLGLVCSVIGFMTSPILLGVMGLTSFVSAN